MQSWDEPATAPEVVRFLRDEVRPLVTKMVAKAAAGYPGAFTAEDRDDLVSVVLTKYHQKWGRDERPDKLGAWLKPVVGASVIDELRRRGARPKLADLPDGEDDPAFEELLVSLRTPSLQAHYALLLEDALATVTTAHPGDRELIHLRWERDLDLTEIAAQLGVSEETAKKRVQRATARLRDAVNQIAGSAGA